MKKLKKHVSMPGLLKIIRAVFEAVPDPKQHRSLITLADCLMSGVALFGLKCPSLLQFEEGRDEEPLKSNLQHLYEIQQVPCDTYFRERLDEVNPAWLNKAFKTVIAAAQRQKLLERYTYLDEAYLLAMGGTGYFASDEVRCENCCVKTHRQGTQTYYHQMLSAVMVHPDEKVVLPLAPEPILKQDGARKNDCERVASKRLLERLRREHPFLKAISV